MGKREWASLVVAVLLAACASDSGDEMDAAMDTAAAPGMAPEPGAGGPPASTGAPVALPQGVTQEMVAAGKTIFESTAPCYTCHGADGSGTPLAPNLRDAEWLNTDGTLQGIEGVVRTGVAQPKQFPAPMPAMGGGQLSGEQIRSVAAYVYTLSHGG
jgi:mono/diheme cytochrome c family protein